MKTIILFLATLLSFKGYGYYFLKFNAQDKAQRQRLANYIHVDSFIDGIAYSVVSPDDMKFVDKFLADLIIKKEPLKIEWNSQSVVYDFPNKDKAYHTYNEMLKVLKELKKKHPQIFDYFSIGKTVEGREIYMTKISSLKPTGKDQMTPSMLITGAHHAREHLSVEVPLGAMKYFVSEYKTNPEIKQLLDTRILYIAPLINPDGKLHDILDKRYKYWRKNRTLNSDATIGVDLNRNYSYKWGGAGSSGTPSSDTYRGPTPFSEPETTALKNFVIDNPGLRILVSFHSYSELILYPWGYTNSPGQGRDFVTMKAMAEKMATWNGYTPQQSSDLYITTGDTCDWAYGEHGIFCFTFELAPKSRFSGGFYPGESYIEKSIRVNKQPMTFLLKRLTNLHGESLF